ncbi:MAG TPA: hypothetical protein VNR39_01570 [Pseudolabrys sp.]|nr:hypothetical protein [Pseudolabrys sp.]
MRTFRNLCLAIAMLSGLAMTPLPAAALTQQQWTNVCTNLWGLRSGANPGDINGAGYGMDNGNAVPMNCFQPAPANWDALLNGTITLIKGFPNSGGRYLLIVSGCPGLAPDYPGAFPKCNHVNGAVQFATPLTMANYTVPQLINWVNATLP